MGGMPGNTFDEMTGTWKTKTLTPALHPAQTTSNVYIPQHKGVLKVYNSQHTRASKPLSVATPTPEPALKPKHSNMVSAAPPVVPQPTRASEPVPQLPVTKPPTPPKVALNPTKCLSQPDAGRPMLTNTASSNPLPKRASIFGPPLVSAAPPPIPPMKDVFTHTYTYDFTLEDP